jgi:hypothetical protein
MHRGRQKEAWAMKLTDVEVNGRSQNGRIQVGGYFGPRRVAYEIPREPLDDYFPRSDLSDAQRHTLMTSNLNAIKAIMQLKMRTAGVERDQRAGGIVLAARLRSARPANQTRVMARCSLHSKRTTR